MTIADKLTEIAAVWTTTAAAASGLTWTIVHRLRRALR